MLKIPVELLPTLKAEAMAQAEVNAERLNRSIDLAAIAEPLNRALNLNVSQRAKMQRFQEAASLLSDKVKPFTACKSGCSYCCNIAATITATEAEIIGRAIGRKPKKLSQNIDFHKSRDKWTGVPCPFLKKGKCSVYESRPIACRLHFNLADTPFFCNTEVPSGDSLFPQLNLLEINKAHALHFIEDVWADIRDFFPSK